MEHLIVRRKSTGANLYKATSTTERNLSLYPRTVAGDLAYLQACSTGQIAMTAENGCAIPTGARPPIAIPTCGTTGTGDGPTWINLSSYDYNGTLFSVRATGDDMLLKFERSDGQPLALKNPDGIDIDNLTFYEHATLSGNVYQWQVNFPSAPSLKLTYKRKSDGATFSKTFTPTVGASNVTLFTKGTTTTPTNPDNPDNPTDPETPVTPPAGGFYTYRGDTYDYPSWPSGSTANKFPVFENEFIKIQLALDNQKGYSTSPGGGGAIWKVFNKKAPNSNFTLLYNPNRYPGDNGNDPVDRSGTPQRIFWGQGLSLCLYKLPKPLETNVGDGANGPPHDGGLGLNPNECGDDLMNSGELLEYNVAPDGQGFHNKTRPPVYGQDRFYLPAEVMNFEKWVRLSGRAMKINYQANFNQTTDKHFANSRIVTKNQEDPCLYFNGLRHFRWYDGPTPYANDGITQITAPIRQDGKGNLRGGTNNGRPGGQFLSEPWIAAVGDDGYGIGLMLKHQYQAAYAYYGDGGFDGPNPSMGGSYGSITASPQEIIDHIVKWRSEAEVIVGTVEEIRAYVYAHSFRPDFAPKFKWNRAGREGWSLNSGDGDDKHTWDDGFNGQASDGWKIYFGKSYNAVIHSPAVIWKAADSQRFYLKYAYSGNQTEWSMSFQRNAQRPDGAPDLSGGNVFASEDAIRYRNGEGNTDAQTVKFTVKPVGCWGVGIRPPFR